MSWSTPKGICGSASAHLHETGDCTAPDGASAGGHWNPSHENHGKWLASPFHRGDIGNIEVGADGKGNFTVTTDLWTIGGAPDTDVIGKAVIIHDKADDFTTQPTRGRRRAGWLRCCPPGREEVGFTPTGGSVRRRDPLRGLRSVPYQRE